MPGYITNRQRREYESLVRIFGSLISSIPDKFNTCISSSSVNLMYKLHAIAAIIRLV